MIEHKPSYFLELWRDSKDNVTFSEIEDRHYGELRECFDYRVLVNGRAAAVYCYHCDNSIEIEDCKNAATMFMKGGYIKVSVDLNKYISTRELMQGKLTPASNTGVENFYKEY